MDQLFAAFDGQELDPSKEVEENREEKEVKKNENVNQEKKRKEAAANDESKAVPQKKVKVESAKEENVEEVAEKIEENIIGEDGDVKMSDAPEKKPAKVYPFKLDGFQNKAISFLEKNESVLVAAHTSAGKTVVAEYAIAMALRDKQRVVYTSPIKALSNQKYRDLAEEFTDVGLMTGDVTINPNASCLVMTTEILRSMLYRGSEVLREVAYAIFDEVHYMRDRERGVVWEEAIVLLPHKVRYVFLSATIPNAQQFCDWISRIHHQPCHAVYTDYRPTPLQHYVYPSGGEGVYLIVDEKGKFHDETFQKAMSTLEPTELEDALTQSAQKPSEMKASMARKKREKTGDLLSILQMVMERNYDPAIVFSFSKRDCEKFAAHVAKLSLNSPDDQKMVTEVFNNAIDSLNDDDKGLPQVQSLLPLLQKGIGIHHGGLLPILKEVTEILFGEGLLKVLFATETFAMGINMPAKTVIFTAMRKYDGLDYRWVNPGEYIQMSGRAGRRGLDDRGIVIQMIDEQLDPAKAKEIMSGQANPLTSTFRISYNMLLNLMRVEDADPEFIIRNSLYTFQQETSIPELEEKVSELEKAHDSIVVEREDELAAYHHLMGQAFRTEQQMNESIYTPQVITPFLKAGRVIRVGNGVGWAVVVSVHNVKKGSTQPPTSISIVYDGPSTREKSTAGLSRAQKKKKREEDLVADDFQVVTKNCAIADIEIVSSLRVHASSQKNNAAGNEAMVRSLLEVKRRFPTEVPRLEPEADLKVKDPALLAMWGKFEHLKKQLAEDPIYNMKDTEARAKLYSCFIEKYNLRVQIKSIKKDIKEKKSLPMKERLKNMKVVLRRLGHVDKDGVIQLKGRVGCEISTADELVLTELLLGGAFNDLSAPQAAALLSCFVYTEPGECEIPVMEEMQPIHRTMVDAAKKVATTQTEAGIAVDGDEFAKSFRHDLLEPVYRWCEGAKFKEICEVTEVFEGTIIRTVRRLVELLRQLCAAARVIGDATLMATFTKAIELIKRDIIFAASLYL